MAKTLRRIDVIVALVTLLACILVGNFWLPSFWQRTAKIHRLLDQPRDLTMVIYLAHPTATLRSESWRFHDLNGFSRIRYTVVGPRGDATVTEPPSARVDVPALFDATVNLGLWKIPRGHGDSHMRIATRLANVWNTHDVYFSLSSVLGRQPREYHVNLSHESASSALALVQLQSTPAPDHPVARYLDELRAFGTPAFRAACQAARSQVQSPQAK